MVSISFAIVVATFFSVFVTSASVTEFYKKFVDNVAVLKVNAENTTQECKHAVHNYRNNLKHFERDALKSKKKSYASSVKCFKNVLFYSV